MHDPKFERSVQQKMEELEFTPSEAVWTHIEKVVTHKKDRRRIPFFWFFLLPGLLLMGAGAWYLMTTTAATTTSAVTTTTPTTVADPSAGQTPAGKKTAVQPGTSGSDQEVFTSRPRSSAGERSSVNERSANVRRELDRSTSPAEQPAITGQSVVTGQPAITGQPAVKERSAITEKSTSTEQVAITGQVTIQEQSAITEQSNLQQQASQQPDQDVFLAKRYWPGPGLARPAAPATAAAHLSSRNTNLINPGRLQTKRPWETGFAGGIGLSTFHNSPFTNLFSRQQDAATNMGTVSRPTGIIAQGAPVPKNEPSEIRPGLSFWAGIVARKPLSSRWAVTVGLDLHYYSSELRTGYQVSYPAANSNSYFSGTSPAALIQAYPYYATGTEQSFVNRYYFLEIPATVQWQINHSRTLPLFWEGGASLSYLMSSNALYFDKTSGVYYKNTKVANKTQVSLATSLLLGLPAGSARLQVGPQIQYGVTNLLDLPSNPQHLFYGGLRVILIPAGQRRR